MEKVIMHEKKSCWYALSTSTDYQGSDLFRHQGAGVVLEWHIIRCHGGSSILALERIMGGIGKKINVGSSMGSC
jgi:hypothetical protein